MTQPDRTMSVTFIGERLFVRRKKRREGGGGRGGGGCLASDGVSLHLNSDRQRERMDEFVAIGAVVPQESVPLIVLRDATYVIRKVCHWKGMIEVFGVLYCIKIAPGNYLLTHNAGTAALHMCAPSSDSAHSMSALLLASSQSAQACACLSPAATRSFVIVQPFYQPELLCIPYEQFFLKSH